VILVDASIWIDHFRQGDEHLADDTEALVFIEKHALMGRGIGYIDVHLLAATALADFARLWTRDRRLAAVARELGLHHETPQSE